MRRAKPSANTGDTDCMNCSQGKSLGRMEGLLESVLANQERDSKKFDALDTRLRKVENRSAIAGAAAALMVTLGLDLLRWKLKA